MHAINKPTNIGIDIQCDVLCSLFVVNNFVSILSVLFPLKQSGMLLQTNYRQITDKIRKFEILPMTLIFVFFCKYVMSTIYLSKDTSKIL